MPNVVVYVKQRHADSFEDDHAMKVWVREAVDRALSERGEAGTPPARSGDTAAAATAATPSGDESPSGPRSLDVPRSESDHFKPDPKPKKK